MLILDDSNSILRTPWLLSVMMMALPPASPDDEPTEPFSVSNSLGLEGMVAMAKSCEE